MHALFHHEHVSQDFPVTDEVDLLLRQCECAIHGTRRRYNTALVQDNDIRLVVVVILAHSLPPAAL